MAVQRQSRKDRSDLLVGVVQNRLRFGSDAHQRRVDVAVDDRQRPLDAPLQEVAGT